MMGTYETIFFWRCFVSQVAFCRRFLYFYYFFNISNKHTHTHTHTHTRYLKSFNSFNNNYKSRKKYTKDKKRYFISIT